MTHFFRYILLGWLLTLCIACRQQDSEPRATAISSQSLVFNVAQPEELRASLAPIAGGLDMRVLWKEQDKGKCIAIQDGKHHQLEDFAIFDVDKQGSSARIRIDLSTSVDTSKPFTICGTLGDIDYSAAKQAFILDGKGKLGIPLKDFKVPLYFQVEVTDPKSLPDVAFKHIGAYELTHITNKSEATFNIKSVYWYSEGQQPNTLSARPWESKEDKTLLGFNIGTLKPQEQTTEDVISILPEASTTFVSWLRPSDQPISAKLSIYAEQENKGIAPSTVYQVAQPTPLGVGRSYHLYATWDGKKLQLGKAPLEAMALPYDQLELSLGQEQSVQLTSGTVTELELNTSGIVSAQLSEGGRSFSLRALKAGTATLVLRNRKTSEALRLSITVKAEEPAGPLPAGVVIENGVLVKWPCEAIPENGKVVIPSSVTSIGNYAFIRCTSLKSITIPNSVTSIGVSTFLGCNNLTNITIPNSVTNIGLQAFYNCTSLKSIAIPNSVTEIGNWAFYNCTSLTSIIIPNSVTNIGVSVFSGCDNLSSAVIPNSVTNIESNAFTNCSKLTNITIPNSVTNIGESAFAGCGNLTSLIIPNSVTNIGESAFASCGNLRSITIPSYVTRIGANVFSYCSSLTLVTEAKTPPIIIPELFGSFSLGYTGKLIVPKGSKALYEQANGWKDCSPIVEEE